MRRARLGLVSVLGIVLFSACIIRPETARDRREHFNRAGLGDVLLKAVPAGVLSGGAQLDDGIRFAGYNLQPAAPRPGDRGTLTLYWEATGAPAQSWRVFVHLDPVGASDGRINYDHEPAGGRYPTQAWRQGDVIRDRVRIHWPSAAADRTYEIWVGFYEGNHRLDVVSSHGERTDGANRILAGLVRVR